jgi:hypothetical protein
VVPEGEFRICKDIACSTDKLQITNKAVADIAKAGVVDTRCYEPYAVRMVLLLFRSSVFKSGCYKRRGDS